jgi:hypothetical protein
MFRNSGFIRNIVGTTSGNTGDREAQILVSPRAAGKGPPLPERHSIIDRQNFPFLIFDYPKRNTPMPLYVHDDVDAPAVDLQKLTKAGSNTDAVRLALRGDD